jgi:hypothetical protein
MTDPQTIRLQPPVWALIVAVLIGGSFYVYGKSIEAQDHTPTHVTVSGEGKVSAAPDISELRFGVQTGRRKTAKEAMQTLTDSMKAVIDAVEQAGVEEKDIRTEQLSLQPSYDWTNNAQTLRGYEATQSLVVKVRDLDKVSDVLGAATGAGANNVGGVQFTIDDPEGLRAQAREQAIERAREKAKVLADQLGMTLGEVKNFGEDGGASPPMGPVYMRAEMAAGADMAQNAPPLPQGEQEVRVNVSITYELE